MRVQSLTTSSGHSGECSNPFCNSIIEPLSDGYAEPHADTVLTGASWMATRSGEQRRCSTKSVASDFTSYWIRHDRREMTYLL